VSAKRVFCTRIRIYVFTPQICVARVYHSKILIMYTLLLLGYTHIQFVLTTRFYAKCSVCDLKTESYLLSRMHFFTTQSNRSHGLKRAKNSEIFL